MKSIITAIAFVLLPTLNTAHASDFGTMDASVQAVTDPLIMGAWKSVKPIAKVKGMTVHLGIEFTEEFATMSSICTFPRGKVLEARVSIQANVADGNMEVLSDAEAEVVDGGYRCNVHVEPGTVAYKVNGRQLRLTHQGQNLDFIRRK